MRILLIEDDRLIGDGLKIGLSRLGFTLTGLPMGKPAGRRSMPLLMMP